MAKTKTTKKRRKTTKTEVPPLNGTWRIKRFPDNNSFPPSEEPDGEFIFDIDTDGKLKNTSKHRVGGTDHPIVGRANANAVRMGHASGRRGYWGVLVSDSGGVMKLAGLYRRQVDILLFDQEQGTWTGTKP